MADDLCLSGGADGADLLWGIAAKAKGHSVVHYSFAGHRTSADPAELIQLSPDELRLADPFCVRANRTLKRRYPPRSPSVQKLLQRDWYQIKDVQSCYAVSVFDERGLIKGGTAWACQMFIDQHDGDACNCYVFDQEASYWYGWTGEWSRVYEPPTPNGLWAGVGIRAINMIGKLAINVLLDHWPREKNIWG